MEREENILKECGTSVCNDVESPLASTKGENERKKERRKEGRKERKKKEHRFQTATGRAVRNSVVPKSRCTACTAERCTCIGLHLSPITGQMCPTPVLNSDAYFWLANGDPLGYVQPLFRANFGTIYAPNHFTEWISTRCGSRSIIVVLYLSI
ncbi:uncharacterized protein LOC143143031 [Ptiloglossa arizonensis]|uniref:uncharacterized protein LOC143143031 n=1 Tax=Ptiloglossa arizonensis TaxID=3350558 RepID=UPI003F9F1AE2